MNVGIIVRLEDKVGRDVDLNGAIEHHSEIFWTGCIENPCIFEILDNCDEDSPQVESFELIEQS